MADNIVLFVNGNKHTVDTPDPEESLIEFLRKNGYVGTKLGCGEGGCGACCVMVSHFDHRTGLVVNKSANACLMPLCSLDGMAVITVEGIGSTRDVLHPIQEAMATANASQCGFCTPGIVMSLYALLRNNPTPSAKEIEEALDGNLCRCTGYRPILDAAKMFSKPNDVKLCPSSGKPCSCSNVSVAPSKKAPALVEASDECPLVGQKHLLFPAALKKMQPRKLHIKGHKVEWFTLNTLEDVLLTKDCHHHCKFVVGNSELAIDARFKSHHFPVLAYIAHVPELTEISLDDEGLVVGASVTLTNMKAFMKAQVAALDTTKVETFKAACEILKWFASTPVRNCASIAGNIVTASPISDLNPVWVATNSYLTLINTNKEKRKVYLKDFFLDYRKVDVHTKEIVLSLHVPFTKPFEFVKAYKQAKRREDDIAIVNSCMRMRFEPKDKTFVVADCGLGFGGMSKCTVLAKETCNFLIGKEFNEQVFLQAIEHLKNDLPLNANAPGGMIEYRRSLTLGFFYKFYLLMQEKVYGGIALDLKSAIADYDRPASQGEQFYEVVQQGSSVGLPVNVQSARMQVTGEAKYLDDIPVQSNELYGYFVLSSEPNAKIISIDESEALHQPGVKAFISAKHVHHNKFHVIPPFEDEELFKTTHVEAVGQPIGLILATSHNAAKKAAHKVKITYEKIEPAVLSIQDAIAKKSYIGLNHKLETGNVDAVFAALNAEEVQVVEGDVNIGGQEHFYLECHGALAIPGERDELLVIASTQNLTEAQKLISHLLGIDQNKITTKTKRLGGGFGGKESRSSIVSGAAAVAAHTLNVPVRIVLDRDVDMVMTGQRHPFYGKYKAAVAKQTGKIVALDVEVYNNAGYSLDLSQSIMDRALFHIDNCYNIPNLRAKGFVCKTNQGSNTAFRGFGGPQGLFICESILDHISCTLNQQSKVVQTTEQLRAINLYKKDDVTHFGQVIFDGDRIERLFKECTTVSDIEKRRIEIAKFNSENKYKKRGIALLPTKFGISFTTTFLNQGGALVHIYTDGTVLVSHGGVEMGQGLHTKVAQVAASVLNVPHDIVFISETSTDKVPNTSPTAASIGSDVYAAAVQHACEQLVERMKPIREKLGAEASWKEIVLASYLARISLSSVGYYATPDIHFNWDTGKGRPFSYFTYGAACSEVEIDCLTGDFQVVRTDIVMDVGSSINPAVDIGQIEGAFVQGLGLFMIEEMVYGDNDHKWVKTGHMFTRGPGAYKIPSFNDIPVQFNIHLMKNAANSKAVYSSKAIGEPPLFLGASVFFATKEAITAFRQQNGINNYLVLDSPATPERIRMSCADNITKHFVGEQQHDKFRAKGSF